MNIKFTLAYKIQVKEEPIYSFIPFTIDFGNPSELTEPGTGSVTFEPDERLLGQMDGDFSIYYRKLSRDTTDLQLTQKEFEEIVEDDNNLFYKYNAGTGYSQSKTIYVQLKNGNLYTYIQLFATSACQAYTYGTIFGHINIVNNTPTEVSLLGNLCSLFTKIQKGTETKLNDNISLQGLFSNNSCINSVANLYLQHSGTNGYQQLFSGCTGLITGPSILTGPQNVSYFRNMFAGCTRLQEVKCLFQSWFMAETDYFYQQYNGWLPAHFPGTLSGVIYCTPDLYTQFNTLSGGYQDMIKPERMEFKN